MLALGGILTLGFALGTWHYKHDSIAATLTPPYFVRREKVLAWHPPKKWQLAGTRACLHTYHHHTPPTYHLVMTVTCAWPALCSSPPAYLGGLSITRARGYSLSSPWRRKPSYSNILLPTILLPLCTPPSLLLWYVLYVR